MTTERQGSSYYTHISVVLDRSGSMQSIIDDTIGGFNKFLTDQKGVDGKATITLVQFDDQYEVLKNMEPLENVSNLTSETYVPRGSTALLDAIARTINRVEQKILELENKPDKVIFVIITDGQENASREFNKNNVFEMIRRCEQENKWQFVFMGANQDAITEAGSLGIRSSNSLTYGANSGGVQSAFRSLSTNMTSYRVTASLQDVGEYNYFSSEDRKKQEQHLGSSSEDIAFYPKQD